MWTVEIIIMGCMIGLNGLFAGYEMALAAVSLARLRVLAETGRPGAKAALAMKQNMAGSLAVIQLGITLFGAIAAATGGAGAGEMLAPWLEGIGWPPTPAQAAAIGLVVLPLTIMSIVFGELIPKVFALRNQEWLCLKLSGMMRGFAGLVHPLVRALESAVTGIVNWAQRRWRPTDGEGITEPAELRELVAVAQLARASHLIGGKEESIIRNAAGLSRKTVGEIKLAAESINMLNADDSLGQCLIAAHLFLHTRFPVTEKPGDPQGIIGYVNFKDIVALMRLSPKQVSLRAILHLMPDFVESTSVAAALEKMMREHTHIALIRDGGRKVVGMITLEDVLEELVGEIHDEHDRLGTHVSRAGQGWVVGGGVHINRLKELTGIQLPGPPVGGGPAVTDWVCHHLGREVSGGDVIEENGLRIVVRKILRGHVMEAQMTPLEAGTETNTNTPAASGSWESPAAEQTE